MYEVTLGNKAIKFLNKLKTKNHRSAVKLYTYLKVLEEIGMEEYSIQRPGSIDLFSRKSTIAIYEMRIDCYGEWYRVFFEKSKHKDIEIIEVYNVEEIIQKKQNRISLSDRNKILERFKNK